MRNTSTVLYSEKSRHMDYTCGTGVLYSPIAIDFYQAGFSKRDRTVARDGDGDDEDDGDEDDDDNDDDGGGARLRRGGKGRVRNFIFVQLFLHIVFQEFISESKVGFSSIHPILSQSVLSLSLSLTLFPPKIKNQYTKKKRLRRRRRRRRRSREV